MYTITTEVLTAAFRGVISLENLIEIGVNETLASTEVLIWSEEHKQFWIRGSSGGGNGYTSMPENAGRFTLADAFRRTWHCDPEKQIFFHRAP